jgi:3-hydroxyisobutyrate dehydrogenase and related beta-hydroxyacid dehydrogenases
MGQKIAFIGLRIMGKPMAKNLISGGYELYVYYFFPYPVAELEKEGATGCKSPAETSSNANITITIVQDGPQTNSAIKEKG